MSSIITDFYDLSSDVLYAIKSEYEKNQRKRHRRKRLKQMFKKLKTLNPKNLFISRQPKYHALL